MKRWELKEKSDAKDFGARRQKGSGNQWKNPGDMKDEDFLTESKQTDKQSYSLNYWTWKKIADEALFSFRIPKMSIQIRDQHLVVMDKDDFLKLFKNLQEQLEDK